jgi:hypothetical protein
MEMYMAKVSPKTICNIVALLKQIVGKKTWRERMLAHQNGPNL